MIMTVKQFIGMLVASSTINEVILVSGMICGRLDWNALLTGNYGGFGDDKMHAFEIMGNNLYIYLVSEDD